MENNAKAERDLWPDVDVATWAPTKKSFHLYVRMLGKLRVALSPAQPNWMFTALLLSARGVTIVERSNGDCRRIALLPVRTVAEIYVEFQAALGGLRAGRRTALV